VIKLEFDLSKCDFSKCKGECLTNCPFVSQPYTEESAKEEIAKLIRGEEARILQECIGCYACNQFCPTGANPWELINLRQEEMGASKYLERSKEMEGVKVWGTKPYLYVSGEHGKPLVSLCGLYEVLPWELLFKGSKMFEGLNFVGGGDVCCKLAITHIGHYSPPRDFLPKLVENLAKAAEKAGTKEVILYHDGCYGLLTTWAWQYRIKVPFKPIPLVVYLRDWLREHRNEIKPLNMKAAYQWGCTTRYNPRAPGYEPADKVVREIFDLIGVEWVERTYEAEKGLCCGCGIWFSQKERRKKIQEKNVMDAKEHGAEIFVFICPVCTTSMRTAVRQAGMEPYHIINLCRLALGEELPAGGAAFGYPVK